MPYLTKQEVLAMLRDRRQKELIEEHLIAGLPFVFQDAPQKYQDFLGTLSAQFRTPAADISIIGSARIGFSLDPEKYGVPFRVASDLDTIIVNAAMFDTAWYQLYNLGRKRFSLEQKVKRAFEEHRRNNVFFGFIVQKSCLGLCPFRPFGSTCFGRSGVESANSAGAISTAVFIGRGTM